MSAYAAAAAQGAQIANNAFQSSQDRKVQQAALMLQQQQAYEQAQQDRARLLLEQQGGERTAQSDAYRKALMGALGMHVQDVGYSRDGGFSGGLRPSALGVEGRQASTALQQQALQKLLAGPEARPELAPYQRFRIGEQRAYEDPTVGHKPGFWDKIGLALNPRRDGPNGDPNYRTPGSVRPIAQPGPLDPRQPTAR